MRLSCRKNKMTYRKITLEVSKRRLNRIKRADKVCRQLRYVLAKEAYLLQKEDWDTVW